MRAFPSNVARAFTLIEVLVSMMVLTVLILLVSHLTNSASTIVGAARNRLDADSQARLIFDCMANDFANMAKRKDLDCVFGKLDGAGANDAMFFFSEAPGYLSPGISNMSKSSVSLVGYRIGFSNPSFPDRPALERLGKNLTWTGNATASLPGKMIFLTTSGSSTTPDLASTIVGNWPALGTLSGANHCAYADGNDPDYHILSDEVYRLEITFLLKNGKISNTPWLNSLGHKSIQGLQDVAAVIVAIALLDPASRQILPASSYASMIGALGDAVEGAPILKTWNGWDGATYTRPSPYLVNSGIPKAAASQIRVYQRYFYLNTN